MRLTVPHLLLILVAVVTLSYVFPKEAFSVPYVGPEPFQLEAFQTSIPQKPAPSLPAPSLPAAALPAPSMPAAAATAPFGVPVRTTVPVSEAAYDAMSLKQRSDLLSQIQRTVREELLAARALQPVGKERDRERNRESDECPSERQGQEYDYRCPKNPDGSCPPVPDLTQYIRKDQIPCWGCSVEY